jgi:hypothetical protein
MVMNKALEELAQLCGRILAGIWIEEQKALKVNRRMQQDPKDKEVSTDGEDKDLKVKKRVMRSALLASCIPLSL